MTMAYQEQPPPLPPDARASATSPEIPQKSGKGFYAGILLVVAGIIVLTLTGVSEMAHIAVAPWSTAFILFEEPEELLPAETRPARVRLAQRDEDLGDDMILKLMSALGDWSRFNDYILLDAPELVIAIDVSEPEMERVLESGRLPRKGMPEVLAGDLARDVPFQIDGVAFEVVGRLKRSASGFLFAYLLPYGSDFAPLFAPEWGGVEGVFVKDGKRLIEEGLLPDYFPAPVPEDDGEDEAHEESIFLEMEQEDDDEPAPLVVPNYLGGVMRSRDRVARTTLFGMALVALGGALFQYHLLVRLRDRGSVLVRPFVAEMLHRPTLFWGMHLFMYGVFFCAMYSVSDAPLVAYRIKQYIEAVFSLGGLGHIGAAYDTGSISVAAWMTFYNNFIEQTLGLTFLISLFPIPLGLIKNVLSFLLVGGAMSPLWVGSSQMLTLHSITMALELEAYVLACFAITAWPVMLISGLLSGHFLASLKRGLVMLASAVFITGVILGIAALYEAFTLIHLL